MLWARLWMLIWNSYHRKAWGRDGMTPAFNEQARSVSIAASYAADKQLGLREH